jgi:hypothetical protein
LFGRRTPAEPAPRACVLNTLLTYDVDHSRKKKPVTVTVAPTTNAALAAWEQRLLASRFSLTILKLDTGGHAVHDPRRSGVRDVALSHSGKGHSDIAPFGTPRKMLSLNQGNEQRRAAFFGANRQDT